MTETFKSYEEYIFKAEFNEDYGLQFMPTGESIVRCKDCKHFAKWGKNVAPDTGYYCTRPNQQSCNLVPEDYCSYAERKEVEE